MHCPPLAPSLNRRAHGKKAGQTTKTHKAGNPDTKHETRPCPAQKQGAGLEEARYAPSPHEAQPEPVRVRIWQTFHRFLLILKIIQQIDFYVPMPSVLDTAPAFC